MWKKKFASLIKNAQPTKFREFQEFNPSQVYLFAFEFIGHGTHPQRRQHENMPEDKGGLVLAVTNIIIILGLQMHT